MRMKQTVPATETEDHLQQHLCTCCPVLRVDAAPGKPVTVTIIHQPLKEAP